MASSYKRAASGMLNDYANLRTIPAVMSAVFAVASIYQFGGITTINIEWLSYTLTAEHATWVSIAVYAIAGYSSETRNLEHYETWEQAGIALGPVLILGHQYTTEVTDLLLEFGDPLGFQLAFVASVVSWGIIAR